MHIAIIIERLDIRLGGAEKTTLRIVEDLLRRGHQVTVLTATIGPINAGLDIKIRLCPTGRPRGALRLWLFHRWVLREIKKSHFDVTFSMTLTIPADVLMSHCGTVRENHARALAMRPKGWRRWGKWCLLRLTAKQWMWQYLESQTMRNEKVQSLIAISHYLIRQVRRDYPHSPVDIVYQPLGIELPLWETNNRNSRRQTIRQEWNVDQNQKVYLFAAMNPRLKGLTHLLHAVAGVRQRGINAVLVVCGRVDPQDLQLAQTLQITDSLQIMGKTDRMLDAYCGADVLVLPTYYDTYGLVLLEAMLAGTPVVTSAYNGVTDWIVPAQGPPRGRIVPEPDDVSGLADAMIELADPNQSRQCTSTIEQLAADLDRNKRLGELEQLLRKARQKKSRPKPSPLQSPTTTSFD